MLDQLAAKVRFLRSSAGLSLQQVADRAGCTKSHIWEIEQGKSANPTLRMVAGLSRAFGVSMTDFINEPEPRPTVHSIDDVIRWMRAQTKPCDICGAADHNLRANRAEGEAFRLREALEFYASGQNHFAETFDTGAIARTALAKSEQGEGDDPHGSN